MQYLKKIQNFITFYMSFPLKSHDSVYKDPGGTGSTSLSNDFLNSHLFRCSSVCTDT